MHFSNVSSNKTEVFMIKMAHVIILVSVLAKSNCSRPPFVMQGKVLYLLSFLTFMCEYLVTCIVFMPLSDSCVCMYVYVYLYVCEWL
jgi:hypothetical protein